MESNQETEKGVIGAEGGFHGRPPGELRKISKEGIASIDKALMPHAQMIRDSDGEHRHIKIWLGGTSRSLRVFDEQGVEMGSVMEVNVECGSDGALTATVKFLLPKVEWAPADAESGRTLAHGRR